MPPFGFDWDTSLLGPALLLAIITFFLGSLIAPFLAPLVTRLGQTLDERIQTTLGRFPYRYKHFLLEEFNHVDVKGLTRYSPISVGLEDVYVPSAFKRIAGSIQALSLVSPISPYESSLRIEELLKFKRVVVLGSPGSGKSTMLRYIALVCAKRKARKVLGLEHEVTPIYIFLRELVQDIVTEKPPELINWLLGKYKSLGLLPSSQFFLKRLRKGRCILLFDGLDEIAKIRDRRLVADWIEKVVALYPHNIFIVSSRPIGYEVVGLGVGFHSFQVEKFDEQRIKIFTYSWSQAIEKATSDLDQAMIRTNAKARADSMLAALLQNSAIKELAVNPLLLSIIATLYRSSEQIPKRRVDLYAKCVDVMLGYWDEAKGLENQLTPFEKRAVLQPLAFALHSANQSEMSRKEVEGILAKALVRLRNKSIDSTSFLDSVCERSGLLVEQDLRNYSFTHLSFQEYLTACEVADNEYLVPTLLDNVESSWWKEVLLQYVALHDATEIINHILSQSPLDGTKLLLLGQICSQAIRANLEVRNRIILLIDDYILQISSPLEFLNFALVRAPIDKVQTLDYFFTFIRLHDKNGKVARIALGQYLNDLDSGGLSDAIQVLLVTMSQSLDLLDVTVILGQINSASLFMLPTSSFRILTQYVLEKHKEIIQIVANTSVDFEGRLWGAKLLDFAMVEIPAGVFTMGSSLAKSRNDERPVHKVFLDTFWIDICPVANLQYFHFLKSSNHLAPPTWDITKVKGNGATCPVVNVTLSDCLAYARSLGKRLPTEAEWEKAARGTDERLWPWGNEEHDYCELGQTHRTEPYRILSYPENQSPYGVLDMAGNVWEWTSSLYRRYPYNDRDGREDLSVEGYRVLRGGSYRTQTLFGVRTTIRNWDIPNHNDDWGFRCVLDNETRKRIFAIQPDQHPP